MAKRRFNLDDNFNDVGNFIEAPKEVPAQVNTQEPEIPETEAAVPEKVQTELSYNIPDKQFRRNITLSEELFRRLEFIKKSKNKARSKDDELVTLDKLMFDMVQFCLDTQYPETKTMFEKYLKIKQMEDFADFV